MELIETLNRTMKLAMDEGRVGSYEEAQALFGSFRLRIRVRPGFSARPAEEAAVLTLLNAAPRTFLGGVELLGPQDECCTLAWFAGRTLAEVAKQYGVAPTATHSNEVPTICVGKARSTESRFWLGVSLRQDGFILSPDIAEQSGHATTVEAGVAAAAAAINEAFQHVYRQAPLAGQREIKWDLPNGTDFATQSVWLIGLGHLGQAYLWTSALGGSLPTTVRLTDYDEVSWASLSTCLLVSAEDVGSKKVDVVAERLQALGIDIERDYQRLALDDTASVESRHETTVVAVDNIALRRSLDKLHGKCVLEAGIGGGTEAFTRIQLHAFPGARKACDIWAGDDDRATQAVDISKPAYQALLEQSHDECGTTLVAGRAIATPFVGAFAGALVSAWSRRRDSATHAWVIDVNAL